MAEVTNDPLIPYFDGALFVNGFALAQAVASGIIMDSNTQITAWVANGVSTGTIISSCIGWTPSVAAIVALVWYCIQIYECETVRNWRATRRQHKLAKLRAALARLEAKD